MRTRIKQLFVVLFIVAFAVTSTTTPAQAASDNVLMKAPYKDAAFVLSMPGIQDVKSNNLLGTAITLDEGLVIRQSRIENGKIIIPKAGLYYTTRNGKAAMLQGHPLMILGKVYTIVDTKTQLDVIKDVTIKKGESYPIGDGTKHLELSSIDVSGNGFESPGATFQILKPSGNYYGTEFPVAPNSKLLDITKGALGNGTDRKTGTYYPGKDGQKFNTEYYGKPIAISGQSYLIVDKVTAQDAHVKEFGTGAMNELMITEKAPVELFLGKGETGKVGDYNVTVTDLTSDSATVELKDKAGKTVQKLLGPFTQDTLNYLPADEITRANLVMRTEDNKAQVQLDAFRKPFRDGKVALVGYTDILTLKNPDQWVSDPRFVARPDT